MSLAKVIESIDKEAFERAINPADEMTLVEYAQKISPFTLSSFQKELIQKYEEALKEDKVLCVMGGRSAGRSFIHKIMKEWECQNQLCERRCSCGRMLGRFTGRAEIKCPKCDKMNLIESPTI